MRNRAIYILLSILSMDCLCFDVSAQDYAPRDVHETVWKGLFAPDSPETVAMLRYGDERPAFYNGQMNMSIPIYTWKDNLFEIPVSIGYSYSGLKPGFTESSVGLGWFLNAGGVITREVRGIPDETYDMAFPAASQLSSMYSEGPINPGEGSEEDPNVEGSTESTRPEFGNAGSPYDGCSIRGFVNLYNGTYDASVLSSGKPMFMYTGSLSNEFTMGMELPGEPKYHCIETEPDVFHFSFMGYSGSFMLQPGGKMLILDSSTPAGELDIHFHCPGVNQGMGSYFTITTGDGVKYTFAAQVYNSPLDIISGSANSENDTWTSWKLSEIAHPSGHRVTFQYGDCTVDNCSAAKSRDHMTVDTGDGNSSPGGGFRPVSNWQKPDSYSETSLSKVTVHDKRLLKILIEDRGEMDFSYTDGMLTRITVNTFAGNDFADSRPRSAYLTYYTPYAAGYGNSRCSGTRFLSSLRLSDAGTYEFSYDSADDQHRFPDSSYHPSLYFTDWYGYYNDASYTSAYSSQSLGIHQLAERVMSARSSHSLEKARMGAMTRVTYPTGGWSTFEYEANAYRRVAGLSTHEDGSDHTTGGIRVRRISTFDSDGTQTQERSISYTHEDGSSSGVLLQPVTMDDIYFMYEFENRYGSLEMRVRREACSPLLDVGYTKDFHVEYLRVVEEVRETASSPVAARTEHRFHSSSLAVEPSAYNTENLTQSTRFEDEMDGIFSISRTTGPVLDWRMHGSPVLAGREQSVTEQAVSSGQSSQRTDSGYSCCTMPLSINGTPASYSGITMLGGCLYERAYAQHLPYLSSVVTTVTEGDGSCFSTGVQIEVNSRAQTASISQDTSDGLALVNSYTYHPDFPALVTSVTTRRGGSTVSKREFSYQPLGSAYRSCLVPYQLREYAVSGDGSLDGSRIALSFSGYDSWCNPTIVTDALGRIRRWTWGYNGLHPTSVSVTDGGRTKTTQWTWIPLTGITTITDPAGYITRYEYDGLGRLTGETDGLYHRRRDYIYNLVSKQYVGGVPYSKSQNFIVSLMHRDQGMTADDVVYYDGLGRESQRVLVTPSCGSTVTHTRYDALGRPSAQSLPFGGAGGAAQGAYTDDWSAALTSQYSSYGEATDALWSKTAHEDRASGRELSSTLPGAAFAAHPATKSYRGNTAGEVIWLGYDPLDRGVSPKSYWPAGTLTAEESIDGDGRRSVTWTDREGRTVCTSQYTGDGGQTADTYYIYDIKGQLTWVLTPECPLPPAGHRLTPEDPAAKAYCYLYEYDCWGRMVSRRLPGMESEEFVYDSADRAVMRRDGNMRAEKYWVFDCRNDFDEPVQSSLVCRDMTREQMQEYFPTSGRPFATASSFGSKAILSKCEYGASGSTATGSGLADAPAFKAEPGVITADDLGPVSNLKVLETLAVMPVRRKTLILKPIIPPGASVADAWQQVLNQVPDDGTQAAVLDTMFIDDHIQFTDTAYTGGHILDTTIIFDPDLPIKLRLDTTYHYSTITRAFYYDRLGRVAQVAERNHLGGVSRTSFRYDWDGNVLESVERHTTSSDATTGDIKRSVFRYDARGRLTAEEVQVNGGETE